MKGIPQTIWLNLGEEDDIQDAEHFGELAKDHITWSKDRIYSGDIKFVREKIIKQRQKNQDEKDLQNLKKIIKESKLTKFSFVAMSMLENWEKELEQKLKK